MDFEFLFWNDTHILHISTICISLRKNVVRRNRKAYEKYYPSLPSASSVNFPRPNHREDRIKWCKIVHHLHSCIAGQAFSDLSPSRKAIVKFDTAVCWQSSFVAQLSHEDTVGHLKCVIGNDVGQKKASVEAAIISNGRLIYREKVLNRGCFCGLEKGVSRLS